MWGERWGGAGQSVHMLLRSFGAEPRAASGSQQGQEAVLGAIAVKIRHCDKPKTHRSQDRAMAGESAGESGLWGPVQQGTAHPGWRGTEASAESPTDIPRGPPFPRASHLTLAPSRHSHLARVGFPAPVHLAEATPPNDAVHTEVVHGQLWG